VPIGLAPLTPRNRGRRRPDQNFGPGVPRCIGCIGGARSPPSTQEIDMDAMKTHGAFSWNELMTTDPDAARRFYTELFGWTFETMNMANGAYHAAKVGDTSVGGIMAMPPEPKAGGMPPNWGSYVTVDDVDATVAQVGRLGGKLLVPATDIPAVGRFAVIQDPQGAALNVITYVKR
jgi:uncharacterized protein